MASKNRRAIRLADKSGPSAVRYSSTGNFNGKVSRVWRVPVASVSRARKSACFSFFSSTRLPSSP